MEKKVLIYMKKYLEFLKGKIKKNVLLNLVVKFNLAEIKEI